MAKRNQTRHRGNLKQARAQLETLESRLLFSADLPFLTTDLIGLNSVSGAYVQLAANDSSYSAVPKSSQSVIDGKDVVIIDVETPGKEQLIADIQQSKGDDAAIYILDGSRDGLEQLTQILDVHKNIGTLHLISHGSDGSLALGSNTVTQSDLLIRAEEISSWRDSFSEEADILIYGCNLAASEKGENFVTTLGMLSSTDVAASDDRTGDASKNGDWALEFRTGSIESDIVVSQQFQDDFAEVLISVTVTTFDDTTDNGISASNSSHDINWLLSNQGSDGSISLREAIIAANNTASGTPV